MSEGKFISHHNDKDVVLKGTPANDTIATYNARWVTIQAYAGDDVIFVRSSGKNIVVDAGAGNDSIDNWAEKFSTVFGGAGNDTINIDTTYASINGGDGNDLFYVGSIKTTQGSGDHLTVLGGAGNDTFKIDWAISDVTLSGGAGKDLFRFDNLYDRSLVITDFSGDDIIQNDMADEADLTYSKVNGNIVLEDPGMFSITLQGVKDISQVADATYRTLGETKTLGEIFGVNPLIKYNSSSTSVTLGSAFQGTLNASDYASTVKTIDATKVKNAVKIIGNAKANTIKGSAKKDTISGGSGNDKLYGNAGNDSLSGGKGNDTLFGGKGNDILIGGAGKDVFCYADGDGKDTIKDYTAGEDKIRITDGTIKSYRVSGSDVILNVGSGGMTLKNAKSKKITIINAGGKEKTYTFKKGTNKMLSTALASNTAANLLADTNPLTAETAAAEKLANAAAALAPASLGTLTETTATGLLTETALTLRSDLILGTAATNPIAARA